MSAQSLVTSTRMESSGSVTLGVGRAAWTAA
jgi:hypothetical protein